MTTLMNRVLLALGLGLTSLAPVWAQSTADAHSAHPAATAAPAPSWSEAEVRKVDKDAKKLTLKHGEIKSLDMPPMTMVFQVRDPAWLAQLKVGSKIRFTAENTPSGLFVTDWRAVP